MRFKILYIRRDDQFKTYFQPLFDRPGWMGRSRKDAGCASTVTEGLDNECLVQASTPAPDGASIKETANWPR